MSGPGEANVASATNTTTSSEEPRFPELPNGPALFYDEDLGQCWFGVPFDRVPDPHLVIAALHRAEWDYLVNLQKYHQAVARRNALKESGVLGRLTKGLAGVAGNIKSGALSLLKA